MNSEVDWLSQVRLFAREQKNAVKYFARGLKNFGEPEREHAVAGEVED